MSRIGRKPVTVPDGVQVSFANSVVTVKGPKGQLTQDIANGISVKIENGSVIVERSGDTKPLRSLHGLYRALIANMIEGVTKGYERTLRIVGTGYRVELKGKNLEVTAGYCHPVLFAAPQDIVFEIPKSNSRDYMDFIVKGIDKQKVMETASRLRKIRPPDLYQGKGIRYADETPRKLEGKSFGSA